MHSFVVLLSGFNSNHMGFAIRISLSLALTLLWVFAQVKFTFLVALCIYCSYDPHSFLLLLLAVSCVVIVSSERMQEPGIVGVGQRTG